MVPEQTMEDEHILQEQTLSPCGTCGRTFLPLALKKHAPICEKNAIRKRKVFDSLKQRVEGTDLAQFHQKSYLRRQESTPKQVEKVKRRSTWEESHLKLVDAIRSAKGASRDTMATSKKPQLVAASSNSRCPFCERQFGPKAFDRHVEWCKEHRTRVQKSPANVLLAKERLEARIKYKVPPLSKSKRSVVKEKYSSPTVNRTESVCSVKSTPPATKTPLKTAPVRKPRSVLDLKEDGVGKAKEKSLTPKRFFPRSKINPTNHESITVSPVKFVGVPGGGKKMVTWRDLTDTKTDDDAIIVVYENAKYGQKDQLFTKDKKDKEILSDSDDGFLEKSSSTLSEKVKSEFSLSDFTESGKFSCSDDSATHIKQLRGSHKVYRDASLDSLEEEESFKSKNSREDEEKRRFLQSRAKLEEEGFNAKVKKTQIKSCSDINIIEDGERRRFLYCESGRKQKEEIDSDHEDFHSKNSKLLKNFFVDKNEGNLQFGSGKKEKETTDRNHKKNTAKNLKNSMKKNEDSQQKEKTIPNDEGFSSKLLKTKKTFLTKKNEYSQKQKESVSNIMCDESLKTKKTFFVKDEENRQCESGQEQNGGNLHSNRRSQNGKTDSSNFIKKDEENFQSTSEIKRKKGTASSDKTLKKSKMKIFFTNKNEDNLQSEFNGFTSFIDKKDGENLKPDHEINQIVSNDEEFSLKSLETKKTFFMKEDEENHQCESRRKQNEGNLHSNRRLQNEKTWSNRQNVFMKKDGKNYNEDFEKVKMKNDTFFSDNENSKILFENFDDFTSSVDNNEQNHQSGNKNKEEEKTDTNQNKIFTKTAKIEKSCNMYKNEENRQSDLELTQKEEIVSNDEEFSSASLKTKETFFMKINEEPFDSDNEIKQKGETRSIDEFGSKLLTTKKTFSIKKNEQKFQSETEREQNEGNLHSGRNKQRQKSGSNGQNSVSKSCFPKKIEENIQIQIENNYISHSENSNNSEIKQKKKPDSNGESFEKLNMTFFTKKNEEIFQFEENEKSLFSDDENTVLKISNEDFNDFESFICVDEDNLHEIKEETSFIDENLHMKKNDNFYSENKGNQNEETVFPFNNNFANENVCSKNCEEKNRSKNEHFQPECQREQEEETDVLPDENFQSKNLKVKKYFLMKYEENLQSASDKDQEEEAILSVDENFRSINLKDVKYFFMEEIEENLQSEHEKDQYTKLNKLEEEEEEENLQSEHEKDEYTKLNKLEEEKCFLIKKIEEILLSDTEKDLEEEETVVLPDENFLSNNLKEKKCFFIKDEENLQTKSEKDQKEKTIFLLEENFRSNNFKEKEYFLMAKNEESLQHIQQTDSNDQNCKIENFFMSEKEGMTFLCDQPSENRGNFYEENLHSESEKGQDEENLGISDKNDENFGSKTLNMKKFFINKNQDNPYFQENQETLFSDEEMHIPANSYSDSNNSFFFKNEENCQPEDLNFEKNEEDMSPYFYESYQKMSSIIDENEDDSSKIRTFSSPSNSSTVSSADLKQILPTEEPKTNLTAVCSSSEVSRTFNFGKNNCASIHEYEVPKKRRKLNSTFVIETKPNPFAARFKKQPIRNVQIKHDIIPAFLTYRSNTINDSYDPFVSAERQFMELLECDDFTAKQRPQTTKPATHKTTKNAKKSIRSAEPLAHKKRPISPLPVPFQDPEDEFEMLENLINNHFNEDNDFYLNKQNKEIINARNERKYSDDTSSIDSNLINENDDLTIPDNFKSNYSSTEDTDTTLRNDDDFYSVQYDKKIEQSDAKIGDKTRKTKVTKSDSSFGSATGIKKASPKTNKNQSKQKSEDLFDVDDKMYAEYKIYEEMYLKEKEQKSQTKKQKSKISLKSFGIDINSDEKQTKVSDDSAYGSLNRKLSPLQRKRIDSASSSGSEAYPPSPSPNKRMSKFCHECGNRYPLTTAKFCVECGVKRLVL